MSIDYIRKTYGCQHKVGDQVAIRRGAGTSMDGMSGKLLRARGQYLVVQGSTWKGSFHPADVVAQPAQEGARHER
ncbi:hypothetical protein C8246_05980 [Paracidovorax avenae]|nr:hypothetical protein C8246_05980 [Paracidovorax avenae]